MKKSLTAFLLLCLCLASCRQRGSSSAFVPEKFPIVQVPSMISDGGEAAGYLAEHYWDEFTDTERVKPCSETLVNGVRKADVEQAFSNYLMILEQVPFEDAKQALSGLFDKVEAYEAADTSANLFEFVTVLVSKYLYDPNSPARNEDLYLPYVSKLAQSAYIPESLRPSYTKEAELCALTPLGSVAPDFEFSDRYGRTYRLHDIKAEYVLLFFSNPGCQACKEIMDILDGEPDFSALVSSGRLAVLNIYIDSDLTEWYKYMSVYPKSWYNGYDPNLVIRNDLLYNVRAIPSLWLLDSEMRILLKDVPQERLFAFLSRNL